MRFFLFLILSVLTSSCAKKNPLQNYQPNPKWELADEIYDNEIGKKVFFQLRKEKKLHLCESGWALRGKKKIQVMHCGFFYYDELNIDQARELLLVAGNLYLAAINENERMRSFLETYPFTPENIEITIFLQNRDRSTFSQEKLCIASCEKGILRYRVPASDHHSYFTIISEERYEEAMAKIVDASKKISL